MISFGMPGATELCIIAGVALLIFGKRLPGVARSIGSSVVEFRKGLRDVEDEINDTQKELNDTQRETQKLLEDEKKK